MADFDGNITPTPAWSDVPKLSTTAVALGGEGGPMNAQAVALTARLDLIKSTSGANNVGADDGASGANYSHVQEGLGYVEGLIDALFKQRSWQTRAVPNAAFSSFGILPTVGMAVGGFGYTETVAEYARRVNSAFIGSGTVWVDPVNGNDSNSGAISSPVLTLDYAVTELGASLVMCLPGTYTPFEFRTTDTQGAKLKILRALGRCVIKESTDDATTATWTADGTYPNCWYMTTTTGHKDVTALLDSTRLDEEGQQMNLVKYSSLASLNAVADGDGWFFDSAAKKLYVRYLGSVDVNTVKTRFTIIKGDSTSRILVYGTKLLFEGNWGLDGVFLQPLVYSTTKPILYMDILGGGVTVRHTSSHGLDALGADSYIAGAWFHRCQGDNLHYADSGSYSCNAVEINCKATKAGDYDAIRSAPNTSNGSSIHGAANIIRINGTYRRNYGPDIVDTGTGKSWNCGVDQGPAMDSGNAYGIYTTGPAMWLDTCKAAGNKQADIAATTSGAMYTFATSYRTTSTSSGGTIAAYTPV